MGEGLRAYFAIKAEVCQVLLARRGTGMTGQPELDDHLGCEFPEYPAAHGC
jgi:hypothetical protein